MNNATEMESWPDVWAKYWSRLSDVDVASWDREITTVMGTGVDGRTMAAEEEVCTAVRALGASGRFTQFRPKIPDLLKQINSAREAKMRDVMDKALDMPAGHISCWACRDEGWVNVPLAAVKEGGRTRYRLPRAVTVRLEGEPFDTITLEPHTRFAFPCLLCSRGEQHFVDKYGGKDATINMLRAFDKWQHALPDQCIEKPNRLRKEPFHGPTTKQEQAEVGSGRGATPAAPDASDYEAPDWYWK